jgi:hypothetical protein
VLLTVSLAEASDESELSPQVNGIAGGITCVQRDGRIPDSDSSGGVGSIDMFSDKGPEKSICLPCLHV